VAPFITANYHKSAYMYIYDDKHVKWRERLMCSKATAALDELSLSMLKRCKKWG